MKLEICAGIGRSLRVGFFVVGGGLCAASLGTSSQAAELAHSPQASVQGHLASGEFGAAVDLAVQLPAGEREGALKNVVQAQIQSGDPAGAQISLARFGQVSGRSNSAGELAREQMLNGGSQANYQEIIHLIQNDTNGKWESLGDADGGTIDEFQSGVRVDPKGVLARATRAEETGRLAKMSERAHVASLNDDMSRGASLRMVSLTRLEQEVTRRTAAGQPVVESMRQLAGLSQIRYVFVYDGEIVIGGPAEGWKYDERGVTVGAQSGRPTLQLDDLVTLLRTFSPAGHSIFSCSIDPRPENLKALKEFADKSQSQGPLSPAQVKGWAKQVGKTLGLQNVTIQGIPANSRVARVLVDADYRMKLIGVGQIDGGSEIPSYFELLAKEPALASSGLEAMRWWLTMKYDAVLHSAEGNAYEISGSAVQCRSENQFLADNGQRVATGNAEPINQLFATNFTQHYQELANHDPIFADLQGIFDLALVAAIIQRDQLDQRVHWDRGDFAVDGAFRPAVYATPRQADSVVEYQVFNGKDIVLQAAGGVHGDLMAVLNDSQVLKESPRLGSVAESSKAQELPVGRWWWDAR